MTKILKKRAVLRAFILIVLVSLAAFFVYPLFPLRWKALSVNDYSVSHPAGWSYANISNGELVVLSDQKGDLSIQDRSSLDENVRLTITKISKKTTPTLVEAEDKYNLTYSSSAITRFIAKVGEDTAVKLIIDNSILQKNTFYSHMIVVLIDRGDFIYQVEGGVYPDVGPFKLKYELKILNKIIDSFHFI